MCSVQNMFVCLCAASGSDLAGASYTPGNGGANKLACVYSSPLSSSDIHKTRHHHQHTTPGQKFPETFGPYLLVSGKRVPLEPIRQVLPLASVAGRSNVI